MLITRPSFVMPALFTRMSSRSCFSRMSSIVFWHAVLSVISSATGITRCCQVAFSAVQALTDDVLRPVA